MEKTPAEILDMTINSILVMGSRHHKPLETTMEALLMEKEFPPCDILIAKWSAMLRLKEKNEAKRIKHEMEKEGGLLASVTELYLMELKYQKKAIDLEIDSRQRVAGKEGKTKLSAYQSGIKNTFGPKMESGMNTIADMRCLLCGEM